MKISEIITDKYKLRMPPKMYYDLLADVVEAEEEQEPCDDAVSRQAVINLIRGCNSALEEPRIFNCHNAGVKFEQYVTELPSVRPQEQTGKWEEIVKEHKCYARDDTYTTTEYHCSECGEEPFVNEDGFYELSNYCPNCGCRMVEPQESEDKE